MNPIVIFDLDGTLAIIDHRRHMVEGEKKDWQGFYKACVLDTVNEPVAAMFRMLKKEGYHVIIFSGRGGEVKPETEKWLLDNDLVPDILYMRPVNDYTPDQKLKERWLAELESNFGEGNVFCIFDDRQKVVDMWRSKGLVCLQVAEGKF
jgi:hypothetical protein